jgi:two-component system phosphate regulon sensor histidine kinase PhoR
LDAAGEGIVGLDADGRVAYANPAAGAITGYRPEELTGAAFPALFQRRPGHGPADAPTDSPILAVFRDAATHRAAGEIFWRKDRTSFPVEYVCAPIRRGQAVIGAVVLFRDISERQRVEARQQELLRRAEAAETRFRTLLESAPDPIVITDQAGRIMLVNRQAELAFGYSREALQGRPIEVLVPPRFRPGHVAQRQRYYAHARTRPMGAELDLYAVRRDGSEFPTEISLSPVQSDDGLLVISVIRDVTAPRALERQKDEFLANVSHDLRTPLGAITMAIGAVLANEPADLPGPLHRLLVTIDQASIRMARLVDDLLELTRLQAGQVRLRREPTDLVALARRAAATIAPLAERRGQRVALALPRRPLPLAVDAERLERALLNLLGNAQKYGRENGAISLRLERRGGEVVLAVQDDGPGIAPEEQQRIFDRFYQAEGAAANQGSGLGLPISRAMVELHGGRLWVESAPGQGSLFSIALPVTPPHAASADPA